MARSTKDDSEALGPSRQGGLDGLGLVQRRGRLGLGVDLSKGRVHRASSVSSGVNCIRGARARTHVCVCVCDKRESENGVRWVCCWECDPM